MSGSWQTQRISHAQLETHGSIGWLDEDGPAGGPHQLAGALPRPRRALPAVRPRAAAIRVFTARVGGGFGGKQEIFAEDLVALAVLRTGRPVAYELSRNDEFVRTSVRHPMRVTVDLGADADGRLTAMKVDVLSDTGAYGNHSRGVLFHGCAESISLYNSPVKRVDAEAVYTNNVPSGAFRGYGLGQVILGVESAMDELAIRARHRSVRAAPDQRRHATATPCSPDMVTPRRMSIWGSYGLDQCLDLAQDALRRGNGVAAPDGGQWRVGEGMAPR